MAPISIFSPLTTRRKEHTWHGIFELLLEDMLEQQPNDGTSI
jgi:hypothetical protein